MARPLPEVAYAAGVHVVGTPLWCDATHGMELCFVSHAHMDHVARHRRILATDRTVKLYQHRVGKTPALVCPYRRPFALGELEIELFPAGHILGSAQIRVRTAGGDLVYTGDFSLEGSRTAERAQVVPCDVLVMEATYGHPRYVFPPRARVEAQVVAFVKDCLRSGTTPVLYAHALGKAQEVLRLLGDHGIATRAHGSIYEICRVYRRCGVELGGVRRFQGTPGRDEAVVFPMRLIGSRAIRALKKVRTAVLTGFLVDPAARRRYKTDEGYPLSDHADFPALLRYVEVARPARVYTVFGHAEELSRALRQKGVDAHAMVPPKQMELF